jgi:3-hydroxyacyl-CoA dehydrogenase
VFARVGVIGAGVMGAGIAAQIANAGVPVELLDIPAEPGRPAPADAAIQRLRSTKPPPLMHADAAELIRPGDVEADFGRLAQCDWILEAIVEQLDAKQALYRRIEAVRRPDTPVSSNTSTIPLAKLTEGMQDSFAAQFCISHFFNPPRVMRLLELVSGPGSDNAAVARVRDFVDIALGKHVVACHDTPGFIANRIGAYWLMLALHQATLQGVAVERADVLLGAPAGIPRTGVFGLFDLIGLDLMQHIADGLHASLPPGDAFQADCPDSPLLRRLIAAGRIGRKSGAGFYRTDRASGTREALDLATGEYRAAISPEPPPRDLSALLEDPYAGATLVRVLAYAAALVPEAADEPDDINAAMRLGYAWKQGPFEMIDRLGPALPQRLERNGIRVPHLLRARAPKPATLRGLAALRRGAPVLGTASGTLLDIGEGVACLAVGTKMGTFDAATFDLLRQALARVQEGFRALVLAHDGAHFSAGANLSLILQAAQAGDWAGIEALLRDGQHAFKAMKYAPFPAVAAPFGLALGGGCEAVLHAAAVQAHAELAIGLVECNVGLVPGWGGTGEMLVRLGDPLAAFRLIAGAVTSGSAAEARARGFLRASDGITMNRDRVVADARACAASLAQGWQVPEKPSFTLPGPAGAAAMLQAMPGETVHDRTVFAALAHILSGGAGGPVSEDALLALEREAFMALVRTEPTQARIAHTLSTGKPLRN